VGIALLLVVTAWTADPVRLFTAFSDAQGSFYAVMPHGVMVTLFGAVFLFALLSFAVSFWRFWPDTGERVGEFVSPPALSSATWDAAGLRYLDGGGDGCTYPDEKPSFARRRFHHFTFYGFMLCFAATAVATIYHYVFGIRAPYPFWSLPVILGTLGGIGLLIGPVGLLWLKYARDPDLADRSQTGMDVAFIALLFITGLTGLVLLALRETRGMGVALAIHLGAVLALFVTLPYGKFVHALYRFAALVRFHIERRRPLPEIGAE
jgi:citrate/tricarballylate utilization protein